MAVNGSRRARPCSGGRGSQRGSLGVVGSSEPPTDPGGNLGAGAELPVVAAPDTAPDTEPAAPTRPNPELCRVFLLRQENAQEKAFSQRPKIFWQIFGSILTLACEGRWRGEAAASGSVPGETFGGGSRVWWWGPAHPPAFINPRFSWCFNFGMGLEAGRSGVGG